MRDVYAQKGLCQIPRLLSLEDRNPFSPTYGCANREFWLCRSTDFPSSIAQFGIHALALAWKHPMPGNPYYQQEKILDWTVAGMEYWIKIQKRDGSFDEFYPNERGWAGPTGFLLYAMIDSYRCLGEAFPEKLKSSFLSACEKAAQYLIRWDEPGVLANHHAMAVLPVFETARLLDRKDFWDGYRVKLDEFYSYCDEEGWCLEYDGADPGYLSATVSFLGKIYKHRREIKLVADDKKMLEVMKKAVDFCAYFAYPNGHYGGTVGSRQTLHFYPHGFELLAPEYPLAGAVAEAMLNGLQQGALVPPEIQGDRYFQYRVPELLLSYIDYGKRTEPLPALPHEGAPFEKYFERGRFFMRKTPKNYIVVNLGKGGIIKKFDSGSGKLVFNDCGLTAQLENEKVLTTNWVDPYYKVSKGDQRLSVAGESHLVVSKYFTPVKFIIFRLVMLTFGWNSWMAYQIKGFIRIMLMTRAAKMPLSFERKIELGGDEIVITDKLNLKGSAKIRRALLGDEMPLRYVPQSRYFQQQELGVKGYWLPSKALEELNGQGTLTVQRTVKTETAGETVEVEFQEGSFNH